MAERKAKSAGSASAGEKQGGKSTKWRAGQSGNPKGRPPGQSEITKLRASIAEHVPEIVAQLVTAAQGGDVQAARRLLLERVLPPVRPIEQTQPMDLPEGDLTAKGQAILNATARGELAPSQAAALIGAVGTLARVAEVDELERRIKALEKAMASLDSRLAALEQRSGQASDRIRLVHIGDDESPAQALERVGATPAERVIFVSYVSPDPERAAKLAAGVLAQEMTTAELLIARDAIEQAANEADDGVAA